MVQVSSACPLWSGTPRRGGGIQLERHAQVSPFHLCVSHASSAHPLAWLDLEVCVVWSDNALILDWIHGPFQFIVVLVVIETWLWGHKLRS